MSHNYTNLLTHVIFSTKNREPLITAGLHDDLLAYVGGIVREIGGVLRAANARSVATVSYLLTVGFFPATCSGCLGITSQSNILSPAKLAAGGSAGPTLDELFQRTYNCTRWSTW